MCLHAVIFVGRSDCECVFADVNMHYYILRASLSSVGVRMGVYFGGESTFWQSSLSVAGVDANLTFFSGVIGDNLAGLSRADKKRHPGKTRHRSLPS